MPETITITTTAPNAAARQLLENPTNLTLGLSAFMTSLATLDKLREYPQILGPHIQITGNRYALVEMNAGCGFNIDKESGEYLLGTPVSATALMEKVPEVLCELVAVDENPEAITLLKQTLADRRTTMPNTVILGDNNDPAIVTKVINSLTHKTGLLMFDPYGAPPSSTVDTYASLLPGFDILIRLNASQCWRNAGAARAGRNMLDPTPLYSIVRESQHYKYWLCSEPRYTLQWCWIFGTNSLEVYTHMATQITFMSPIFQNLEGEFVSRWHNLTNILNV